jgi:hypothetical protein
MLIQLLRSEPLEPRLENGKRLHYNFKFIEVIQIPIEQLNQQSQVLTLWLPFRFHDTEICT